MRWSALALLLFAPALEARAFECTVGKSCLVSPRWKDREATFRVMPPPPGSSLTHEQLTAATRAAFARWTEATCTDLVLREDPSSPNIVHVVLKDWRGAPAAAALTRVVFDGLRGDISTATIGVNLEGFRFAVDACSEGTLDLEAVLTHEVGHFIGLAHPCEYGVEDAEFQATGEADHPRCPVKQCEELEANGEVVETVLWPVVSGCQEGRRELRVDDVSAVCSIYPRAARASPCVELPPQPSYIGSVAFGCGAAGATPTTAGLLVSWMLLIRRRRR